MHIDTIQPEFEPEAPFARNYHFFPSKVRRSQRWPRGLTRAGLTARQPRLAGRHCDIPVLVAAPRPTTPGLRAAAGALPPPRSGRRHIRPPLTAGGVCLQPRGAWRPVLALHNLLIPGGGFDSEIQSGIQ
jgi:hypothetical protein